MKYLLMIHGVEGAMGDASPDELQASMVAWNDLNQEMVEAGAFVAGDALQLSESSTTVTHAANDERVISDGPFAETKEQIGGYYVLECADLDEALDWAKKCPVREGNVVEVRPVMDFSGAGYSDPYELAKSSAV